jgi:biotin carboxyl carrier protein
LEAMEATLAASLVVRYLVDRYMVAQYTAAFDTVIDRWGITADGTASTAIGRATWQVWSLSSGALTSNLLSQDWMDQGDYMVWHGWQQMLGGSSMGYSEQFSLLEGLLEQDHGNMSRRELKELTERIMKMNKELGAGDDGRVKEIVEETSTTTTTTSSSTVTQQQRYDTANAFLQLLTSSDLGFTLEQAQQKADQMRQGKLDTFVTNHLEKEALKAMTSQQAIQAPPQPQIQNQVPQPMAFQQQQPVHQQPLQLPTPQYQQPVYAPPPQQQI